MNHKVQLREIALTKRGAINAADHAQWSRSCCQKIFTMLEGARSKTKPLVVAGYLPHKHEIDVTHIFSLFNEHYISALPRVEAGNKELSFRRWNPGDTLVRGAYELHEPSAQAEAVIPDVVIVPLLAFDRNGNRIGYGGGYYDVTLSKLRPKHMSMIAVGAAFSVQEITSFPIEAHDVPLDWIITEKEAIQTS